MQHSTVCLSDIKKTFDLRIDAEYWHPSFIKNSRLVPEDKKIKKFVCQKLLNIKSSPIHREFEYLEISNISLNSFQYETIKIQEGEEPDRAHYILEKNDVAVSTVRPNRNAVAFIDKEGVIGSSGLAVLRARDIEPEYLFAFCKTDYFIKCLMRENKASMYPAVSNKNILEVPLFMPSENFRRKIKENIQKALSYVEKSKDLLVEAQSILLSELGLSDCQPKHQLAFIKQYSEVEKTERMDAEYFQPKYEEIIHKIKNYKGGWDTLENLGNFSNGSFISERYYSESGKKFYIRIKELSFNGPLEKEKMIFVKENFITGKETTVRENDFVFATIGATIGKVNIITKEFSGSYPSNNTSKFTLKKTGSPFYFETLLRSFVVQQQIKRLLKKTTQAKIANKDLQKIVVPLLPEKIQNHIQTKIFKSLNLHKQSKQILEDSKYAVEKAIEQDEQSALAWLKAKLSEVTH